MWHMDDSNAVAEYSREVKVQRALAVLETQVSKGLTVQQACDAVGVPERTFYRWLADGILSDELTEIRQGRAESLGAQAAMAMPNVVRFMVEIATGKREIRGANPVAAAKWLCELAGMGHLTSEASIAPDSDQAHTARIPQMVQFNIINGGVSLDTAGRIEVVEGEYATIDEAPELPEGE